MHVYIQLYMLLHMYMHAYTLRMHMIVNFANTFSLEAHFMTDCMYMCICTTLPFYIICKEYILLRTIYIHS